VKRLAFWAVFLLLAAGTFAYLVATRDPLRQNPYLLPLWVKHNIRLLSHPHPAVAHDAWLELWNLYFTRWAVYQQLPAEVGNAAPIAFLIERESFPAAGEHAPAMEGFFARRKPIYYKTERVYCRTVGEALMAIMYREKKWTEDYRGDWAAWWQANAAHYR
jgi:hypothetical protein